MRNLPLRLALLLLSPAVAGCIATPIEHSSPLRVRNQHPAQLTAIHADARPMRAPAAGEIVGDVRLDWTSLWLLHGSGNDVVHMDGEMLRTELDFRVGLGNDLDLEVGIPFLHAGGGTLDGFIEGWHRLFNLPQNNRDENPRDRFRVETLRRQRDSSLRSSYRMEDDGLYVGDIPVFLTWFPYREGGLSLGVRGGIELPTGDESAGYGNGGLDANLGILGGYDGIGWSVFGWAGHSFVATADRAENAGLDYSDVDSAGIGAQLALSEDVSALLQIEFDTSVLRKLDESHADKNQLVIWSGGRWRISETVDFEFAVGEELILDVSPDVTFQFGLTVRF